MAENGSGLKITFYMRLSMLHPNFGLKVHGATARQRLNEICLRPKKTKGYQRICQMQEQ